MSKAKFVTCDLYLSHSAVAPLCVGPDLHHVVPVRWQGKVDGPPARRVQGALGLALLPVQDLDTPETGGWNVGPGKEKRFQRGDASGLTL